MVNPMPYFRHKNFTLWLTRAGYNGQAMDEKQKNIARDTISGALVGTGWALWQETALFSSDGKKLSIIGRNTFIGGLIGGAVGFLSR